MRFVFLLLDHSRWEQLHNPSSSVKSRRKVDYYCCFLKLMYSNVWTSYIILFLSCCMTYVGKCTVQSLLGHLIIVAYGPGTLLTFSTVLSKAQLNWDALILSFSWFSMLTWSHNVFGFTSPAIRTYFHDLTRLRLNLSVPKFTIVASLCPIDTGVFAADGSSLIRAWMPQFWDTSQRGARGGVRLISTWAWAVELQLWFDFY